MHEGSLALGITCEELLHRERDLKASHFARWERLGSEGMPSYEATREVTHLSGEAYLTLAR